jgi:hypothetical protein
VPVVAVVVELNVLDPAALVGCVPVSGGPESTVDEALLADVCEEGGGPEVEFV